MEVPMNQCIEVPANQAGVLRLIAFVDEIEQRDPLPSDQSYLLRLVIEEIATNIVKYGYPPDAPGVIKLRYAHDHGALQVIIRDHGQPFDPREHPDPDMGDDPATRQVGGLGLFLVRQLCDELHYHHDRASGWNELVVIKREVTADV
jgi:anti-sigma regulatory factor (Ser/Thr protein kinase)